MIRGKVISFDRIKGYGFVAPDSGGEDVFIHVNDLYSDKSLLGPGSIVEFRLDEGDRGPKASAITVVSAPAAGTAPAAAPAHASAPAEAGAEAAAASSPTDFEYEITEALLRVQPELTSGQILDIRKRLLRIAQPRG